MLGAADQIHAVEFDKKPKKPQLVVENSLKQQTTKFWNMDSFYNYKITQISSSNWIYLQAVWDLQTLLYVNVCIHVTIICYKIYQMMENVIWIWG